MCAKPRSQDREAKEPLSVPVFCGAGKERGRMSMIVRGEHQLSSKAKRRVSLQQHRPSSHFLLRWRCFCGLEVGAGGGIFYIEVCSRVRRGGWQRERWWSGGRGVNVVRKQSVHEGVLLRRSAPEVLDAKPSISSQEDSLCPIRTLKIMSTMNSDAHILG